MNNDNSTPQPKRNGAIAFAIGLAIAVGFGTAGSGDYDQALADQALRTSMQQQGLWPKGEEQELPMEALTSTDVLVAR